MDFQPPTSSNSKRKGLNQRVLCVVAVVVFLINILYILYDIHMI